MLSQSALTTTTDNAHNAAIAVVEQLHTALLEAMQLAGSVDFSQRYSMLAPTIERAFDIPVIAKVILGRHWQTLMPQKQEEFIHLFNRQTIATYASRFDSFDDHVFKMMTVEPLKKNRVFVRTEIWVHGDSSINMDYLLHRKDQQWFIISVIANGVNDLALKRAEYSAIINKNGYDSLIKNIAENIAEMENH